MTTRAGPAEGDGWSEAPAPARGPTRVAALDGLRGVAALVVFGYHLEGLLDVPGTTAFAGGFLGVDVFFALSGYLILHQLLDTQAGGGRFRPLAYAAKRAVRLLPLLVVYLAVVALYELSAGTERRDILGSVVAQGLFLPGSVAGRLDYGPLFTTGHLWSLSVEVHFYVVIPLLAVTVLHRRRPTWVAGGALALLVGAIALARYRLFQQGVGASDIYSRTTARIDTLLVGAGAALLVHRARLSPRHVALAGWAGLGLLTAWVLKLGPYTTPWLAEGGYTVVALAAAALVVATATGAGPAHLFERGPLPAIGRVSYGLYVWHLLVIVAVLRWVGPAPWPVEVIVAVGATGLLTHLSWHHLEAPAIQRLRARLEGTQEGIPLWRRLRLRPAGLTPPGSPGPVG